MPSNKKMQEMGLYMPSSKLYRLELTGGGEKIVRAKSENEAAHGYMVRRVTLIENDGFKR
jgi:hypothetical protein